MTTFTGEEVMKICKQKTNTSIAVCLFFISILRYIPELLIFLTKEIDGNHFMSMHTKMAYD